MAELSVGGIACGEGPIAVPTGFTGVGVTAVPAFDTAGITVGMGVEPDLKIRAACLDNSLSPLQ